MMGMAALLMTVAGNGGYGRLGHEVQQDEFKPKQIQRLTGRTAVDPNSIVRPTLLQCALIMQMLQEACLPHVCAVHARWGYGRW